MISVDRVQPETPKQAGRRFRQAVVRVALLLGLLWLILGVDASLDADLRQWGVRPGQWKGLSGLILMPLLHGGIEHLVTNTLPLLLLGVGFLFFYPRSAWRVLPWFWVVPGLFTWLIGDNGSTHFGISGLNFALLAYIGLGGLLRRAAPTLALSLLAGFYYGSMLSGVLPIEAGISWESHPGGFLIGLLLAAAYRGWDIPPRRRYDWEDEDEEVTSEGEMVDLDGNNT